jgi:hypothetical protein
MVGMANKELLEELYNYLSLIYEVLLKLKVLVDEDMEFPLSKGLIDNLELLPTYPGLC